jgi:hypothetical protein
MIPAFEQLKLKGALNTVVTVAAMILSEEV